jgi:hypothetical protein
MICIFRKDEEDEYMPAEALIHENEEVEEIKKLKNFNDRIPEVLKEGEFSRKMFTFGWKFNMFNEVS